MAQRRYWRLIRIPWSRASNDNIRLWNASDAGLEAESAGAGTGAGRSRSGVPFKIIPGHHGGIVSQMGEWYGVWYGEKVY